MNTGDFITYVSPLCLYVSGCTLEPVQKINPLLQAEIPLLQVLYRPISYDK